MTSPRSTVLVLSSDPGFLKVIPASWPSGAEQPEFTLLEHDLNRDLRHDNYDLVMADAVLDPVSGGAPFVALWEALVSTGKPAIVVYPDAGEPLEEKRRRPPAPAL